MQPQGEKKWFVFLGDHHEGPFSLSEIQSKVENRLIGFSNFVWADGMDDWRMMSDVPDFAPIKPPVAAPAVADRPTGPLGLKKSADLGTDFEEISDFEEGVTLRGQRAPVPRKNALPLILAAAAIGCGLAWTGYFVARPWLFPPIPRIENVTKEDFSALADAASASLDSSPSLAVAAAKDDLKRPTIYVSTNLPDGATIDVTVEGVPGTLVGKLRVLERSTVMVSQKLGKVSAMTFRDQDFPIGEYQVFASESENQPDAVKGVLSKLPVLNAAGAEHLSPGIKLLARKTYFFGGTKNSSYSTMLQAFHTANTTKSRLELDELHQLSGTIEAQLQQTLLQFAEVKKSRAKKNAWPKFHSDWIAQEQPIAEPFQKNTPEVFESDYVHVDLYELLRQVDQNVQKLHGLQNDFLQKPPIEGGEAAEIQLGEAVSVAQNALVELKTKINQAELSPVQ